MRHNIVCTVAPEYFETVIGNMVRLEIPRWRDAHIPRTEKPVRFAPAKFAYWYARWHMRPVYCRQSPLPRIGESVIYRDA